MKLRLGFYLVNILFLFFLSSCSESDEPRPDFLSTGTFDGSYFPSSSWKYCSPNEVGLNESALIKAYEQISDKSIGTEGFLIIKDGYIIAEDYFAGFGQGEKHMSFSVAKSFTSAIVGIAIDKGFVNSEEDLISEYYTELDNSEVETWKKELKISHLLTMTSGLDWSEQGFADNDLISMFQTEDYVNYVLSRDMLYEPGSLFKYNSGESMLLSGIINIKTGKSMLEFGQENLFKPIGINHLDWDSDSENHTIAGWGIKATMEDFARFGYLFLNDGNWDGQQLISKEWISKSTMPFREQSPFYGYLWWLSNETENTRDYYMAVGAFGQYIIIVPSHNLLIVRVATDPSSNIWDSNEFITMLIEAIDSQ